MMGDKVSSLSVVLFGHTSAIYFGDQNILLGPERNPVEKANLPKIAPKPRMLTGRHISVINILDLYEAQFHMDIMDKITDQLVKENKIHAFIFILQLGQMTDSDKLGLEWLQRTFGEGVLQHVIILFTYERDEDCDTIIDDLKKNSVLEELVKKCQDRYHTCSKTMDNQSEMRTLLEKIDHLVSENNHCYTAEMYHTELKRTGQQNDMEITYSSPESAGTERQGGMTELEVIEENLSKEKKSHKIEQFFVRFSLRKKYKDKMKISDVLQVTKLSLCSGEHCAEDKMVEMFLQRLLMMDYRARYIKAEEDSSNTDKAFLSIGDKDDSDVVDEFFSTASMHFAEGSHKHPVHPMDVQMAVFHCSDSLLKQLIMSKLSQCQYALPLLVPDPFTREIEFPLWTFRQIKKSWKTTDSSGKINSLTKAIYAAETPMVAFFKLGSVSTSKSQLMNRLINEKHNTFFHRHCPGSSRNSLLMDGVVEIAWYLPSGKSTDHFPDCVAFCNLHGEVETNKEQLEILTEMSSVNVVLLADHEKMVYKEILQKLLKGPKSLICLLSEDDFSVTGTKTGKYKIGLKDRNESDVSKELRETIKDCLSKLSSTFSLTNLCKNKFISTDEDDPECQNGKKAAVEIMKFLDGKELYKLKDKHLPCQGKLWHDWCEMNKDLYRLQADNLEMQKSIKQTEMKRIREQQHNHGLSGFIEQFVLLLNSLEEKEKSYFLKWFGILLDKCTSDDLSALHHEYSEKWTKVLDLKKKHDKSDKMRKEQTELEKISEKLNAATFGLEHVFREMGQVYESLISTQTGKKGCNYEELYFLPKIAAELVKSGLPMELMDGDAGHVPLIWVSAVLDELIKILGDKRVFVLSVLGIQSSGKSTMLNAMFGLQFAVSAGRCTRGAFIQMVKVSEEMKTELKFDYILVVDTEGLRTLELAGKSTRHHDNELATFVIGLGNMTLVNIFGENPAEMQDILEIVVQALLRMKKVRLNPSCMFAHQNVGDITAEEKNVEGKRHLQEKLDEMTKLAAKEEDSEAECFSDVITFNVQEDVQYFAQLWEGSPPMAPPNPYYSSCIQELKRKILTKMSANSLIRLSQFKSHISNLWNALLNENFVFSFKNTLEVAVYRKLEHEYSKWTWSLRSAMMAIENKLHNRVINNFSLNIEEKDIMVHIKETKTDVEKSIKNFFDKDQDKEILIQWRKRFERKIKDLHDELVKETKRKLDEVTQLKLAREKVDREKSNNENELFKLSKQLAYNMKNRGTDENDLKKEFEDVWSKWVIKLTQNTPSLGDINFEADVMRAMSEGFELNFVHERKKQAVYKKIDIKENYTDYVILSKQQEICDESVQLPEGHVQEHSMSLNVLDPTAQYDMYGPLEEKCRNGTLTQGPLKHLTKNIIKETKEEIQRKPIEERGYNQIYIPEIIASIKNKVKEHESKISQYKLKREFTVDLCLYVCNFAVDQFASLYKKFKEANDVREYLKRQRSQYFNIFKNYYNGATSTAVFGKFIVEKLEQSILQAAYDQTAIDLTEKMKRDVPSFSGNRSNLEKHILTSLAEEENFDNFIQYIHKPKEHVKHFITKEVNNYIFKEKCPEALEIIKTNIECKGKCVIDALKETTEEVANKNGDIRMWLQHLSRTLKDEVQFKEKTCIDLNDITDLDFLHSVVKEGLTVSMVNLCSIFKSVSDLKLEMFRKKPDQILIEHLCRCCWVQCPFCSSICTNTMEDHTGDHMVRFHRNCGINGWSFKFTDHLGVDFCTTAVSSNLFFHTSAGVFAFKDYRKAGGEHARWNITPDNSEMPYWKWFVCKFQEDLEKYYKKQFKGAGEIPSEWKNYTKDDAIRGLNEL